MKKEQKKIKGWVVVLINLAAMILTASLLVFAVFKWMHSYTRHGQYIAVPDLSGMVLEDAAQALKDAGLQSEASEFRYEPDKMENEVVEQRPKAGSLVKGDHIIYLTLNTGKIPMKSVPDVADNSSLRAAVSKLKAAGFKLTEPEYKAGDQDWVYELKMGERILATGEEVPEGSTLTLVVGNGEAEHDSIADFSEIIDTEFFQD